MERAEVGHSAWCRGGHDRYSPKGRRGQVRKTYRRPGMIEVSHAAAEVAWRIESSTSGAELLVAHEQRCLQEKLNERMFAQGKLAECQPLAPLRSPDGPRSFSVGWMRLVTTSCWGIAPSGWNGAVEKTAAGWRLSSGHGHEWDVGTRSIESIPFLTWEKVSEWMMA